MLISYKRIIIISIVLLIIIFINRDHARALLNNKGETLNGSYRNLIIGTTKRDAILMMYSPQTRSNLKIIACVDSEGQLTFVFDKNRPCHPLNSNLWIISYPGIHKEIIDLYFENDRIKIIKYKRNLFSP